VLDKRVDDLLKKEAAKYPELSNALSSTSTSLQRMQFQSESESFEDGDDTSSFSDLSRLPTPKDGLNRKDRRFRKSFLESDAKKDVD